MTFIWVGLIITLGLIELLKNNLITIWYALSSVVTLVLSLVIDNYLIQFSVFVILGTILSMFFRDKALNILRQKQEKRFLGKIAIVCEEVSKKRIGKVKIGYRKYNAISNKKIKKDKKVKIIGITEYILQVEEVKR